MRHGNRFIRIVVVALALGGALCSADAQTLRLLACNQPLNSAGYCNPEVDDILLEARATLGAPERRTLYERLAAVVLKDRPIVYLYHANVLWAYAAKLQGLRVVPDGVIRPQGIKLN